MATVGASGFIRRCSRNGLIRNTEGFALVFFIILIPVIIMSWILISDMVQAVTSADFDIKDTLDFGIRTANYQVDERSQAAGNARVNADRAHTEFRNLIVSDLKLDPVTLAPIANSPLAETPKYSLIVYNGDSDYSGCPSARKYHFDGAILTTTDLPGSGFPADFRLTENDADLGGGGVATVRLEHPGCVAWMKAKAKKALGKDPIEATRWMASEIHYW